MEILRSSHPRFCIGSEGVAARSRKKFRKKVAYSLDFIRNSSARAFLTASRRILFLRCEKSKSVYFLQRERTGPILGRFCVHEKDVHYATDLSDATSVSEGFVRHEMSLPGE
jgi:hypothetical protein